jgi:hypothetical protein
VPLASQHSRTPVFAVPLVQILGTKWFVGSRTRLPFGFQVRVAVSLLMMWTSSGPRALHQGWVRFVRVPASAVWESNASAPRQSAPRTTA